MNTPSPRRTALMLALALAFAAAMSAGTIVRAQVAGATTQVDTTVSGSTREAMGWSVKKTLLGKAIYNEDGQRVGKIEDLIIAPDRNVSYVIVGAGGFIGIGRHDVAVPVAQIQDRSGRLVMAGATQASVKAMPQFAYARGNTGRDAFVAAASQDIARGKARVAELDKQAGAAVADAKVDLVRRMNTLQVDLEAAEAKVDEMKRADTKRWKEYEAGVNAATARLRKALETAAG